MDFNNFWSFNADYQILICKKHQYAIRKANITAHLNQLHKEYTKETRKELANYGMGLNIKEPIYPTDIIKKIPYLAYETNCYRCLSSLDSGLICPYICSTLKGIQWHNRSSHLWKHPGKKGRYPLSFPGSYPWKNSIYAQRFFISGADSHYFEINNPNISENNQAPDSQALIELGTQKLDLRIRELNQNTPIPLTASSSRLNPNVWLNHTRWDKHLKKFSKEEIREWIEFPTTTENDPTPTVSYILIKGIKKLFFKAQKTVQRHTFPTTALFYINKAVSKDKDRIRPFNPFLQPATIINYSRIWQKIVLYLYNTWNLPETDRPAYQKNDEQILSFERLITFIESWLYALTDSSSSSNSNSDSDSDLDSDSDSDSDKDSNKDSDKDSDKDLQFTLRLQELILDFILYLLDNSYTDFEFTCPLISGLAVLGLKDNLQWLEAKDYTSTLSGIITTSRLLALHKAYLNRKKELREKEPEEAKSVFEFTKSYTDTFLTVPFLTLPTPFDYIYKLRAYGLQVANNTTEIGTLYWEEDILFYKDISLSIKSLRDFIQNLTSRAYTVLYSDLLFLKPDLSDLEDCPKFDITLLIDNPTNSDLGYSFLSDPRNTALRQINTSWLYNRLLATPNIASQYIENYRPRETEINWNLKAFSDYFNRIRAFKDYLLILAQLSSGAPARGTELLSIRYKNTENGLIRSVFIEKGLISLVPTYHKGFIRSAKPKIIHRYLPREVSILYVYYLWLIIPFERNISILLAKSELDIQNTAFLWPEKARSRANSGLSPIRKRIRRNTLATTEIDPDIEPLSNIANPNLSLSFRYNTWTSNQLSQLIKREFIAILGLNISLIDWRHILIGIIREHASRKISESLSSHPDHGSDSSQSEEDSITDIQAGHTSFTADRIYARDINELSGQTATKRERFYQLSTWLHRFYLFESTIPDLASSIRSNRLYRYEKWKSWQEIDLLSEFQKVYGFQRSFQSLQESGLKAILSGISPIIIIMGTGMGKSLFFLLPAIINFKTDSLSVLIIPLISLRTDLLSRAKKLGIKAKIWDPITSSSSDIRLLLITPESVFTSTFSDYLHRQIYQKRLDRIYIDECHIILDSTPDYRPKLLQLKELLRYEVQLIYLTATLPPDILSKWYSKAGIRADDAKLLRDKTTRPNIQYTVMTHSDKNVSIFEFLRTIIAIRTIEYEDKKPYQIIVYAGTISLVKKVGTVLNCPIYHGKQDPLLNT